MLNLGTKLPVLCCFDLIQLCRLIFIFQLSRKPLVATLQASNRALKTAQAGELVLGMGGNTGVCEVLHAIHAAKKNKYQAEL